MVIQDQQGTGDIEDMKKSCVIYDSWSDLISNLPDELAGQLIKMVLGYAFGEGCNYNDNPALNAIFEMMKSKIDEDYSKYYAQVERAKNNSKRSQNEVKTMSDEVGRSQNEVETMSDEVEQSQDEVKGVSVSVYVSESDKDIKKDNMSDDVSEVIDYLNSKLGTKYKKGKATTSMIKARLDEGHTVDDFKTVIDKKIKAWADDPKMAQYLRPETLFRPSHFESYLNEIDTGRASPAKKNAYDMTKDKHAKIHNFSGERNNDYESMFSELINR